MPTRCNRWFLLQILLLAQHVSGTIMSIIRSSRVLYSWLLPVVFGALVFKLSVWCGAEGYVSRLQAAARKPDTKAPNITGRNLLYNTLELLMMGIMVPETCWASNKICNKNHLLHLVGILFLHINDDARSKSLQMFENIFNYIRWVWPLCIFENLTCISIKIPEQYLATGHTLSYSLQFIVQDGQSVFSPPAETCTLRHKLPPMQQQIWWTGWSSWLRHWATSRKVAGSIPNYAIGNYMLLTFLRGPG